MVQWFESRKAISEAAGGQARAVGISASRCDGAAWPRRGKGKREGREEEGSGRRYEYRAAGASVSGWRR